MSVLHAGPQLAPPEEQQFSPEGTAERHSSTAAFSALTPVNGVGDVHCTVTSHAPGGPALRSVETSYVPVQVPGSNEVSYPQLLYFAFHAVASLNISYTDSEWFPPKVQPVMSLSKASAPWNMLDSDDQPDMQ